MSMTPAFLRRLGEATAGLEATGRYFVVVKRQEDRTLEFIQDEGGMPVIIVADDTDTAVEGAWLRPEVQRCNGPWCVFGPLVSPGNRYRTVVRMISSRKGDKAEQSYELPEYVDLMCWSASAFEKFVAPYYYRVEGGGNRAHGLVEQLRRRMVRSQSGILIHRWPTYASALDAFDVIGPEAFDEEDEAAGGA
jgi:hypothetical protein